ncbi:MAG: capsule assembly Wzi family protein [Roseivirga sp.]|nr:capsule assembly Wzi family protein [Roseivirga sp.]
MAYQHPIATDSTHEGHVLSVAQSAVLSGKSMLPFWFLGNNSARLNEDDHLGLWTSFDLSRKPSATTQKLNYFYGLEANGFAGSELRFSVIQAYAGIRTKFVDIHFGAREEFFGLNDTTLSIGNLFYGNNARPIPKVVVQTPNWRKSPIFGSFLSFKAYLAHGWLEKDRYQSGAYLHQKYLYFRAQLLDKRLQIIGGLHHSAQWSGHNDETGTGQPSGLSDFWRILTASSGNENADRIDQLNALGNHLGTYDLNASFRLKKFTLTNYWQFMWEDKSGLTPFNWRDGLVGFSIKKNSKQGLIYGFNLEIIRTNSQDAIKYDEEGNEFIEPDNFFNNSIYQSGWTFDKRVIGNPIFLILNPGARTNALVKNMVNGVNLGLEGRFKQISYRFNYRHLKTRGTFRETFNPAIKLSSISGDLELPLKKSNLRLRGVIEWGNYPGKNAGLIFTYSRQFGLK